MWCGRAGRVGAVGVSAAAEPSAPRVTVWRKLRRLGAAQLLDGLVALPADAPDAGAVEWLAEEVLEAGGEAWVWLGRLGSAAQERALARADGRAVAGEYVAVMAEAGQRGRAGGGAPPGGGSAAPGAAAHRGAGTTSPEGAGAARVAVESAARDDGGSPMRWATRAGVHVDRAACAWLMRRFVDPLAEFVFVDDLDDVPTDATPFDMRGRRAVPP